MTRPFHLGRAFDLVQCPRGRRDPLASETLVDSLVAHAPLVLFSAAPTGQGGENHINERPYEFWRRLFEERGYELFDFLRPRIRERADVEAWCRYNLLLFARKDKVDTLHPDVAASRVGAGVSVRDVSPIGYRVRKLALSALPASVVTRMALIKQKLVLRSRLRTELS